MKIRGLKRLKNKVNNLREMSDLRDDVKAAAIHVMGKIKVYPPATAANLPPAPYYERGFGVRYANGGGRRTSEDLLHRWTVQSVGNLRAVIGNNASYAVFVHSEEKQASFHGRRGWKTDKEVLDEERDFVMRKLQVAVRRELEE